MNAAASGDTILVQPGTYTELLSMIGKSCTLRSDIDGNEATHDIATEQTIIKGGITVSESPDAVIEGFTFSLNYTGINVYKCNASLLFNKIIYCKYGVRLFQSTPTILYNSISDNEIAGVAATNGSMPVIMYNLVNDNGDGLSSDESSNVIAGFNIIRHNTGLGIACENLGSKIIHNEIEYNAGGIRINDFFAVSTEAPVIRGNTIRWNDNAGNDGGGICIDLLSAPADVIKVTSNVITHNVAGKGGGIFISGFHENPEYIIYHNTIANNAASYSGGGIYCTGSTLNMGNTILWNNAAPSGLEIYMSNTYSPTKVDANYCDVKMGPGFIFKDAGTTLVWGSEMLYQDPLFVNPQGGDFHLTVRSPCINRGTDLDEVDEDVDFNAIPSAGSPEMGADEFTAMHSLQADRYTYPSWGGVYVLYELNAGPANANRFFVLCTSISGTLPGTNLGNGEYLPLKWDFFTDL
ncbi:MAG: right-handed parallel beta-helix repeat-containing protein, partial [Planctomycetota bacterium]